MGSIGSGNGASSRRGVLAFGLALAALLVAVAAGQAATAPQPLWQRCDGASGDLPCSVSRGVGVNPSNGDVYVSDSANNRIVEYDAWGRFVRAWGWGVANGAAEAQVCTEAASCKPGIQGGGRGELAPVQGVAVDSAGNVYVSDRSNRRVQKFDSEGHFIVMFGGKVNKTKEEEGKPEAQQNRCPVDPTDVCQAGVTGTGQGQFGAQATGSFISTGPSPGNLVYVGDKGRVQVFNPDGTYKEDFPDPEGIIGTKTVQALAAAPTGGLYLAFSNQANVVRVSAAGKKSCETTGIEKPTALAMAQSAEGKPTGDLYVYDEIHTETEAPEARRLSAGCAAKEAFAQGEVSGSTGIAAGAACRTSEADLYISNSTFGAGAGYLRAYGPAPDKTSAPCPAKPPYPPTILAQYAVSVGTVEATLRAQVNPRFYADTSYELQYGTAACLAGEDWSAPCVKEAPASPLSLGAEEADFPITGPNITIGGLGPATAYRYRFIAQSGGGGPVAGPAQSFLTHPAPGEAAPCPNDAFRSGAGARLPDCRAYEMVSPVDKEGGQIGALEDIRGRPAAHNQAATSGEKLTYSSYNSFADPESSPYTSQYIAQRGSGGWESESISPPRGTIFKLPGIEPFAGIKSEFEAFSPDLCKAWFVHDQTTAPPLVVGGAPYNFYVYGRENCGTVFGYEALGKASGEETKIQGSTPDGTVLFRTDAHLIQSVAAAVGARLICATPTPVTVSYQWLADGEPIASATASEYTVKAGDAGKAIQCRMKASDGGGATIGDANPAWVIEPFPATAPAVGPEQMPGPSSSGPLAVGGAGGQTLGCETGSWEGATGFAYRWYRNGTPIAGAEAQAYQVQASDLTSAAAFQCEALASNAGSAKVVASSLPIETTPGPEEPVSRPNIRSESKVVYESSGGELSAVCILPSGRQSNGCSAGTGNSMETESSANLQNALSEDGSTVFWTSSPNGQEGRLIARVNGEETIPVSESVSSSPAHFWAAAANGSRAIFSFGTKGGDLYEFDLASETPTLIAHHFYGFVGASEDATRVYFVSKDALAGSGQNSEGAIAVEGQPNLYLHEGGGNRFVGTLAEADIPNNNKGETGLSPVAVEPYEHAARTSPGGQSLAFMSRAALTGYDNHDAVSGAPDAEVFHYDAASGELACASCNPSGERPSGLAVKLPHEPALPTASQLPRILSQLYPSRALAENGKRLFFESFEPLALTDTNGKADVYEWEAPGSGTCATTSASYSAQDGGCVTPISSGKSPTDSSFIDASPDGRDAFFSTGESLLPQDPGSIDIYDAREGGGFPPPAAPRPPCEGEACQSPPPAPAQGTPASAAFRGQANPAARKARRCPKGRRAVRRNGRRRCVAKHRRRHPRHHRRAHRRHHRRAHR